MAGLLRLLRRKRSRGVEITQFRKRRIVAVGVRGRFHDKRDISGYQRMDENIALTPEAELRDGTMASRLQFVRNRLNDMAISIGGVLAPILVLLVDSFEQVISVVSELVQKNPQAVQWRAAFALALAGLGAAIILALRWLTRRRNTGNSLGRN